MMIEPTRQDYQQATVIGGDDRNPSQSSTFDNQTMDEIAANDAENLLRIIEHECETYHFDTISKAMAAAGEALRLALLRFGIEIDGSDSESAMNETLKAKGVRVESRLHYTGEDGWWRSGIYVYRNNEIAYFISKVRSRWSMSAVNFNLSTNIDIFSSPRIYSVMGNGNIIRPDRIPVQGLKRAG